jgi:hypothetical protein
MFATTTVAPGEWIETQLSVEFQSKDRKSGPVVWQKSATGNHEL